MKVQEFTDNNLSMNRLIIINILVLMLTLSVSFGHCSDLTINLSYPNMDAFPYQVGDGELIADPPGIAVEIIAAAAEDVNVNVKFRRIPNKRLKSYLRDGKIDGAFLMSYEKEREILGVYPMKEGKLDAERRVATVSYSLYRLKGDGVQWDGKKITGLGERSIVANRNYSIINLLNKMGVKVKETDSTRESFGMLRGGRGVAAYAIHGVTGDAMISREGYSEIEKIGIPLKVKDYFLIFSHQFVSENPGIVEKIWSRIAEIRESKTKEIASKYN
jgi:polar amino acid transport system substrate-binding protein